MELFVTLFTAAANFLLGLFTYLKNPKSATNRCFVVLTTVIGFWALANYFSLHSPTAEETLFWIRAVMFITAPLGPILYLLVQSFPNTSTGLRKTFVNAIFVYITLTAVLAMSPYMFTSVSIENGNIQPTPGPGLPVFALGFIGGVIAAFITLIFKFRKAKGFQKVQLKYLLLGIIATFSLVVITNFFFVLVLKVSAFVIFGPLFSLILVGAIAYSIIKHRFLDINVFLVRSVSFTLLILLVSAIYSLGLFSISTYIAPSSSSQESLLFSVVLTLFFTFTFYPLRQFIERITERFFFRRPYNTQSLLQELSREMASTLLLSDLAEKVLTILKENMNISSISVILLGKEVVSFSKTIGKVREKNGDDTSLINILFKGTEMSDEHILVFEEMPESSLKEELRKEDVKVVLPLIVKNEVIGGLFVCDKESGDIYSSEDVHVFQIIAPQLAVAVRNALSYDEIKRFNITLEEEVDRATSRLKQANERLKELDKLKDEFVSVASHELRTPMTAIKSYLWLAMNNTEEALPEEVKSYLDIAYRSTERLIRLVQDMLTISRIEGKRLELHQSGFDLYELTKQVYEELKIKGDEKNIQFSLTKSKTHFEIKGDKEKLREVIQNLVGNALKFTPPKGKVTLSLKKNDHNVCIEVKDTGPGIAPENLTKLFQKFGKIDSAYKATKESGTGLGLYISKKIIDLHGGNIEVQSEVGKGTVFQVCLPEYLNKN